MRIRTGGAPAPPFRFLYEFRPVVGENSPKALKLPGDYAQRHGYARPGYELVPTPRAEELVAYLLNLKDTYLYPEARPYLPPKKEGVAR